jgi:DNA-binding transcriptional ArsR family regulator
MALRDGALLKSPRQPVNARPLISSHEARSLISVFKVLSNDTRLRLLQALARSGELCGRELTDRLAMKPQRISNQLRGLCDRGIVEARRAGNKVYYRIVDPCVISFLDQGEKISREHTSNKCWRC